MSTVTLTAEEQVAWDTCQKGTRVRFQVADRVLFDKNLPRSGEGTVDFIWNCMGEICWDVIVSPTYEQAVCGGCPADERVGIFPSFGDLIEPVTKGS